MKTVYVETSVISYLASAPSRDLRVAAWQQITAQWWEQEKSRYELFASELVLAEAAAGDQNAAQRRLDKLVGIPNLKVSDEAKVLAARLISDGGMPARAEADALHVAIANVHAIDYLLTWNCRHIDNAATKPVVRAICAIAGYACPEICTPLELLSEETENA